MKALGSLDQSAINFVKKSVCCGCTPGDMKVCCGTKSNFIDRTKPQKTTTPKTTRYTTKTTQQTQAHPTTQHPPTVDIREQKRKLLPSRKYCGYQHTDDRPYRDNATALDEFPWLVHVIFLEDKDEDTEQYLDRCNGVLINNRYVLTTDYCATYAPRVRLGQYNTKKDVACIEDPLTPECSEPWLEVGVEEEIHRYDYGDGQLKEAYNFALLRLNQSVSYSDYIRPICLPQEESTKPSKNQPFYFSGWGALNSSMVEKKRLIYDLTSVDECYKIDNDLKADSVNISLMCLKPQQTNGELTCSGDQAGPLTYPLNHQWFAEGIIMKVYHDGEDGAERCSNTHPINAARITPEIIDWILDNIRS